MTRIGATARGCSDPAFEQPEIAYLDALEAMANWKVDGERLTRAGATDLVYAAG